MGKRAKKALLSSYPKSKNSAPKATLDYQIVI